MGVWFPQLTKRDLLELLEACPQNVWPPRPTHQDVGTLREIVRRAYFNSNHGTRVRAAVEAKLVAKRTSKGEL